MNAAIRIRRAQVRGAMNLWCVQSIAALQEGRRLVHTSAGLKQRAALAGITEYLTPRIPHSQAAGYDPHDKLDFNIHLFGTSIIPQE